MVIYWMIISTKYPLGAIVIKFELLVFEEQEL